MEDQQSEPSAVTETGPEASDELELDPAAEPAGEKSADATEAEPDGEAEAESEPETAVDARRGRRKLGLRIAVAASAALFVGSAAFAAAAAQPYLLDRAEVATKIDVARTAARAIHTLWNYTPENLDTLPDRAAVYLSGDLEAQYRKFIAAIADSNKQAKVTDSTEIVGAAVESLNGPEATVLIYTNTSATSELSKTIPQIKYLTYRLYMKRDQNRWVVTRMPTITSLDLTPRFQS
ncbi:mammalian cell entry protein [Mycolicibacter sinensis]|uniref:Mammalian cell entry protein n=1 Tax=Mycolicibacter sinensis (strain JDM601) TaxID=875328 RepID=A0A1A3U460_MYCSD|nr:mammalian cell entry protein [Mycolicibacter sinensis]OBK89636.1 mammalian cell entry protein [Mycolicibacter sinensis]